MLWHPLRPSLYISLHRLRRPGEGVWRRRGMQTPDRRLFYLPNDDAALVLGHHKMERASDCQLLWTRVACYPHDRVHLR